MVRVTPSLPAQEIDAYEAVAIALAFGDAADTVTANHVPERVWDDLHDRGLIQTRRDFTGEARTTFTNAGRDALCTFLKGGR